jgi:broad specificity phosphatase PhoE
MGESAVSISGMEGTYYRYTTVTGYFHQDDPSTNPETFDYATTDLGLIDRAYDTDLSIQSHNPSQWQRFARELQTLNEDALSGTRYILAYLARHGEGWHNRAEKSYGTKEWDCRWSMLDGDGEIVWADAHLTNEGDSQALAVNAFWKREITERSILTPEKFFVSPLDRCLRTAQLTWSDINLPSQHPFKPEVKELLRECIGIHTCDRRSNKTYIESSYPYRIEPGFAEDDPLWLPDFRESDSAMTLRLKSFLDDIFTHHDGQVFSLTSHGGAIAAILRAIGHRDFPLRTGTVIPVLIKAELVRGEEPNMPVDPWKPKPSC